MWKDLDYQSLTFAFLFGAKSQAKDFCLMSISSLIAWSTLVPLVIGALLNGLEVWLIIYHSPSEMRVYSQILLQICAVDVLTLVLIPFNQPVNLFGDWWMVEGNFIVTFLGLHLNVTPVPGATEWILLELQNTGKKNYFCGAFLFPKKFAKSNSNFYDLVFPTI